MAVSLLQHLLNRKEKTVMRAWKLTLFLLFIFAVTACAPKPAEQPEAAPVPDTSRTAGAPSDPPPEPPPVPPPAPPPPPKPVAKPKPTAPAASTAPAATAAPSKNANEAPLTASRDKDVAPPAPRKPEPIVIPSVT